MLDQAQRLADEAGLAIDWVQASAEATGLPPASFDIVIAGQCWHWFDKPRATAEAKRLLKPNGLLAIAHFDWLPLPGNMVTATERLIEAHNPNWTLGGGTGRYPQWARAVEDAGFDGIEIFEYELDVPYSHEAWRGRIRASAGVGGSLAPDAVQRFDDDLKSLLTKDFPGDPLAVPHRVWAMTAYAPR
jgi:SAM-dependent methyltransferase